ncbi:hypothetical protein Poly24_32300 [Rosistilla carotiformis]|uniref:PEP-CTERM protein-sorting domain-containing protein n=1 Tax=Rosistilla carotiformis TaxID=2528017 RepID=A0A518JVE2_9BACT|nr:hypothetical protein [Rosistilla carotiformis]QDV69514.1 hypothetical protein Poly24_32300 [Rosistilla carotiformis]
MLKFNKIIGLGFLSLVLCFASTNEAKATLISELFQFNAPVGDPIITTVTHTVTANVWGTQVIRFDLNLTVTDALGGNVYDTSRGDGLSLTPGGGLQAGDELQFSVTLSNFDGDFDGNGDNVTLGGLTFKYLGTEFANGSASEGTVVTPSFVAGSSDWKQANLGPPQFLGHTPGGRNFKTGQTPGGNFNVTPGFDLQYTNAANGGSSNTLITSFSHITTASYSPGSTLNNIVVQVRANPEPSSLLLGLLPASVAMMRSGGRRKIKSFFSRKK